jgi:UPF0755 protein
MTIRDYIARAYAAFREHPSVRRKVFGIIVLDILFVLTLVWFFLLAAPGTFPTDRLIEVAEDATVEEIAIMLEEEGVVQSSFLFKTWMRVSGADRSVHAGTYYFAEKLNLFQVASRIKDGERGIVSIRVTLTEGMTSWEMGDVLAETLPDFNAEVFTELAKPHEGYLFPDTYFFDPGTAPEEIVTRLRETFDTKTETIRQEADAFDRIVVMASLIEKEADTPESRRIVSGILWNRIEIDMPLQVDAVFGYILGRSGYAPTGEDLDIDSPYNTYRNRELPPGPIANTGLDSLDAALHPASTDYFYYLTGRDGEMYYAADFEGHKRNRELYLD